MTIEGRSGMREIAWHMMGPCLCWWESLKYSVQRKYVSRCLVSGPEGGDSPEMWFLRWKVVLFGLALGDDCFVEETYVVTIGVSLVSPAQWVRRMGGILHRALMILTKSNSQMRESRNWRCYWPRFGVIYDFWLLPHDMAALQRQTPFWAYVTALKGVRCTSDRVPVVIPSCGQSLILFCFCCQEPIHPAHLDRKQECHVAASEGRSGRMSCCLSAGYSMAGPDLPSRNARAHVSNSFENRILILIIFFPSIISTIRSKET